jgi:hypothetical protein
LICALRRTVSGSIAERSDVFERSFDTFHYSAVVPGVLVINRLWMEVTSRQ